VDTVRRFVEMYIVGHFPGKRVAFKPNQFVLVLCCVVFVFVSSLCLCLRLSLSLSLPCLVLSCSSEMDTSDTWKTKVAPMSDAAGIPSRPGARIAEPTPAQYVMILSLASLMATCNYFG
jgi:hypothetical protein